MFELIPKTNIDFIGKRYTFFAISAAVLLAGAASLALKKGPKWGLDFTGGTLLEVRFQQPVALEDIRKALREKSVESFELQSVSGENTYIIRTKLEPGEGAAGVSSSTTAATPAPSQGGESGHIAKSDKGSVILSALGSSFPANPSVLLRKEYVGPTVGAHLIKQTFWAFLLTFVGIIIYVAFRFDSGIWGAAGVVALVHDVFATVGAFSLTDKEISVTIVAALLTIAGYSINDTIVIFDFMRERLRLRRAESMEELINRSLNDTLSRTIITNFTVFLVVLVLFFFGGEVIHDFAFAMLFGAIVGTYSSLGLAAPLIFEWELYRNRSRKKR